MFNLSGSELIFLVIIALVVLGPDKLPEAMRKAGKAYADFKKMTTGFQNEMKSVLDEPMREIRETAELAKSSAMFDTKPFTDSLKDLGSTVTKPAAAAAAKAPAKPARAVEAEMKPVSGSMAAVTPATASTAADPVVPAAAVTPAAAPAAPPPATPVAVAAGSMSAATARSAAVLPPSNADDDGFAVWPTEPPPAPATEVRTDEVAAW